MWSLQDGDAEIAKRAIRKVMVATGRRERKRRREG